MVNALFSSSGSSGPGSSHACRHRVVFWARHFTFTVPLNTQLYICLEVTLRRTNIPFVGGRRGSRILLNASFYKETGGAHQPDWPRGSYADVTYL